MMRIILTFVVGIVLGIVVSLLEQLGIGTQLRDRKGRFLSLLGVVPIAVVCCLVMVYLYIAGPMWLLLLLSPFLVVLGVAAGIYLVGRILPDRISTREE